MSTLDTILIKLGLTYKEGISAEDLYHATSVSWKLSGNKLESGKRISAIEAMERAGMKKTTFYREIIE